MTLNGDGVLDALVERYDKVRYVEVMRTYAWFGGSGMRRHRLRGVTRLILSQFCGGRYPSHGGSRGGGGSSLRTGHVVHDYMDRLVRGYRLRGDGNGRVGVSGSVLLEAISKPKTRSPGRVKVLVEHLARHGYRALYTEFAIADTMYSIGTAADLIVLDRDGKLVLVEVKTGYDGSWYEKGMTGKNTSKARKQFFVGELATEERTYHKLHSLQLCVTEHLFSLVGIVFDRAEIWVVNDGVKIIAPARAIKERTVGLYTILRNHKAAS
jgi:hypothetical protein